MSYMAQRVRDFSPTIFAEMNDLSDRHRTVNLGSGFPDFPGPAFIKQAAIEAIKQDVNQYTSGRGRWRLRQAIAEKMADFYGLRVDPDREMPGIMAAAWAIPTTMERGVVMSPCGSFRNTVSTSRIPVTMSIEHTSFGSPNAASRKSLNSTYTMPVGIRATRI